MAELGVVKHEDLDNLRKIDCELEGHPTPVGQSILCWPNSTKYWWYLAASVVCWRRYRIVGTRIVLRCRHGLRRQIFGQSQVRDFRIRLLRSFVYEILIFCVDNELIMREIMKIFAGGKSPNVSWIVLVLVCCLIKIYPAVSVCLSWWAMENPQKEVCGKRCISPVITSWTILSPASMLTVWDKANPHLLATIWKLTSVVAKLSGKNSQSVFIRQWNTVFAL